MQYETEKLEFKEVAAESIYKSVVAFANTGGGTILIGISRQGAEAPLPDVDDAYTRVTNGVRDAIAPDVTIFIKYHIEENDTIRIEVSEGSYKPYYLKSKGLKPSGVYIRQGASSVQASPEQIRHMIKNADGDAYEELRSLEQELSFVACAKAFSSREVEFGEDKYNALGIRSLPQGQYANLGLLFSDQCAHTIKAAVFSDERNTVFRARKEFTGSVFTQMEEAFAYLELNNQNRSVINGLARIDHWDYPGDALREALINALIHRDYSFSGSIIININEKRMEFISLGGLLPGLTPEDIRSGISQLRNRSLAGIFHRLNFIESYGTGIRRIYALYEDCPAKPEIAVTPNSFKIILPNRNNSEEAKPYEYVFTPQMRQFLDCLHENEDATDEELQQRLGIKRTRMYALVNQMAEAGFIRVAGRGKGKKYYPQ
ncbi:MAG: putative DNA binding domain-containing protein [Clostridiales bacterium]|nr:putative DNA binding domain-containing protein [Clostridiales bacterium]